MIVNALYHSAVVSGLAISYSRLSEMVMEGAPQKLDFIPRDVGMVQTAQAAWSRRRIECLDWINEELRRQGHAIRTIHDVNDPIREYAGVTGNTLDPLDPEPKLSDFYTPSASQKDREIMWIVLGMTATGLLAYKISS